MTSTTCDLTAMAHDLTSTTCDLAFMTYDLAPVTHYLVSMTCDLASMTHDLTSRICDLTAIISQLHQTSRHRRRFAIRAQVLSENNFGGVDALLRGLVSMFAQSADRFVTDRLTDHLFEDVSKPRSGLDLVSMNIQRGRDHGLNGYNAYREFCGLKKATSFSDLEGEIDDENTRNKLASVYDHVDDIDLFTGGLSERPLPGALIGPTFGCIIGEQFRRLRQCDRYWYETSNLIARFTLAQLGEIRKVTFGKVICDNSDNIPTIHPNVMSMPDDVLNARISCSSLGTINLKYWTESTSCDV
ncbi:PREDICTED: peroxidase skpo-1-like, partial [Priapulus caudatus]|uniref:Peroxidase skpo-1-like n=1 Tax=Priapulus caudatus TaxID=37621 RepID=A0ABM1EWK5_PRICU